ncbi:hypothetical protein [Pedobacter nutrimenti]|uniref:hypothetical protein n=1 Tax=Pedobacter nutrimenti TaxID=1241337 RepID=UPI00292F91EF|nr:hypothetical protein [Pedobacter nutrimenti]
MRKQRQHINRILSVLMLMVFSIALTPWSALHDHEDEVHLTQEKNCTHKLHISSHSETCLICAAHFEKDFVATTSHFQVFLTLKSLSKTDPLISSSYTELIDSSLRGPPVA